MTLRSTTLFILALIAVVYCLRPDPVDLPKVSTGSGRNNFNTPAVNDHIKYSDDDNSAAPCGMAAINPFGSSFQSSCVDSAEGVDAEDAEDAKYVDTDDIMVVNALAAMIDQERSEKSAKLDHDLDEIRRGDFKNIEKILDDLWSCQEPDACDVVALKNYKIDFVRTAQTAINQGNQDAMYGLGMYWYYDVIPDAPTREISIEKSLHYLAMASELGHTEATKWKDLVSAEIPLDSEEVAEQ
ncbi:hypothetical protein [Hydrogenophaga sp.]|uniref:hypothetical protein n=1 Tax=Hydrogenophaga sp. TaxID=1904254 RepID=UPI003F6C92C1